MGMFDYIHYDGNEYQTKDTPKQTMDNYKIELDPCSGGVYLFHEDYDAEWNEDEGLFGGSITQSNQRWVICNEFDGNIRFYRAKLDDKRESWKQNAWIEYSALFIDGKLLRIKEIKSD